MLRPIALFAALLAVGPVAALSVSVSSCNEHNAELVRDDASTSLKVDGTEVPLEAGDAYEELLCVTREGETLFGLIQNSGEEDETYHLLDPETLKLTEIDFAEAEALEFWEDEDDWGLDLGD